MARTKKRSNKTSRKSQTQVISELRKKVRKLVKENKMLRSQKMGGGYHEDPNSDWNTEIKNLRNEISENETIINNYKIDHSVSRRMMNDEERTANGNIFLLKKKLESLLRYYD